MEVTAQMEARKPSRLSPFDHYVVAAPEKPEWDGLTIGEIRAMGCPECGEELTATGTCSKNLSDYVRLSCMEHGLQPILALQKGKAYLAE